MEPRDRDFAADYCKAEPQFLTIKGLGLRTDNIDQFVKKLHQKFEGCEEFDAFELKDYVGIKATQFNLIIKEVKKRLAGRELLCFSIENCSFSSSDTDMIDIDDLYRLCSKAY